MSKDNVSLMQSAKRSLSGNWGVAVGVFLVYALIMGGLQNASENYQFVSLIILAIAGPLSLGLAIFSLNIARDQEARFEQLFEGFQNYRTSLIAYLLMILFVFLWTLLLIIPGIIAAISYSMIFFIIADDSSIEPKEALDKSKAMMNGYKLKYFYLWMRIIGLGLLCILTLGIGFLWLIPYANVVSAKFYDDIKDNPINLIEKSKD